MNSFNSNSEKIGPTSEPEKKSKKRYNKPIFRFERVFETSALACGKVSRTQQGCGPRGKS
jgi:hypothetical protein